MTGWGIKVLMKRPRLTNLLAILLALAMIVAFAVLGGAAEASDPTASRYEYYTTNDDAGGVFYGYAWVGQTFTTGADVPHTVSMVRTKLYRAGSPGTLTAYIYETSGSLPTGMALGEGSIDADNLSNSTGGGWYFIELDEAVYLETGTEYAIVLEAGAGDASNAVYWRYDNGNGYADGQAINSADGGGTWGNDAGNDMMFEVWGHLGIRILGAKVYSNFMEAGDQLFVFPYQVLVGETYVAQNPVDYFNVKLSVNTSLKAQMKLPAWGYMPGSFYLDADVALEWGGNLTIIEISGIPGGDFDGDSANYTLVASDWAGVDLELLDDWVLGTAGDMELFYDVNLIVPIEGGYVLNDGGGTVFNIGVPGLATVRPHLFGIAQMPSLPGEETHTTDYQDSLIGHFGANAIAAFNNLGDFIGVGGTFLSGAFWIWIVAMGVTVLGVAVGQLKIGLLCAMPLIFVGIYLGIIPLVYVLLPTFLAGAYVLAKLTIWRA